MIREMVNIHVDASDVEVLKRNKNWILKYKVKGELEEKKIDSPFDIEDVFSCKDKQCVIISRYSKVEYQNTEI